MATARALAHGMGIPHLTLDLREPLRRPRRGRLRRRARAPAARPNPCVRCNGMLRFDAMLDLAERLGAARLATGHYARIEHDARRRRAARSPRDRNKDQTYMLAALADRAPRSRLVPARRADQARGARSSRARAALPVADKPESQDLCFLAGAGGREALPPPPRAGRRGDRPRRRDRRRATATSRPPHGPAPLHGRPAARHRRRRPGAALRARQGRRAAGACSWARAARSRASRVTVRGAALHRARGRGRPREAALPLRPARRLRRASIWRRTPPAPRSSSTSLQKASLPVRLPALMQGDRVVGWGSDRCRPKRACRLRQ